MKRTTWLTLSLSVAAVLVTAVFALSSRGSLEPPSDATALLSESAPDPALAPGEAALRARINPETGEVDVSSEPTGKGPDAHFMQALRRDTEGLTPVFHPDGAVSVHLQGRFQCASVAYIDANGKHVICSERTDDVHCMIHGLSVEAPGPTPEVR